MLFYSKCWISENNVALELHCIHIPRILVLHQDISITTDKCHKTEQIAVDKHRLGRVVV
jgi:hypothetical protein